VTEKSKPRVAICMPAYQAAKTLRETLKEIPEGSYDLILGDDASTDGTADLAEKLDLHVIRSPKNRGYGGNQKQIYHAALDHGADIIVMLHPDGQYDARLIPAFVEMVDHGVCDMLLGNRVRTRRECLRSGMPWWKYLSNRLLTITENVVLGVNLGEFHSGFRVYRRQVLLKIPFENNSEGFLFDTQLIAQAVYHGFTLGDAPTPVRYFSQASSISFKRSVAYGLGTLWVLIQFWLQKLGLGRFKLFRT
jgi:glycosyltransferase involved in cell wall biosynthesis